MNQAIGYAITALIACLLHTPNIAYGQYATVTYNYEKNLFGENQPLPADKPLMITGATPPGVEMVEIRIYSYKGKERREPLTQALWKKPYNRTGNEFSLPINYKLRGSKEYDLSILFYQPVSPEERQELFRQLSNNLEAYLYQVIQTKKDRLVLSKKEGAIIRDLNDLVRMGLRMYRSRTGIDFPGFSDIVRQQLKSLDKARLNLSNRETAAGTKRQQRATALERNITRLLELQRSELRFLLNQELVLLSDSRYIDDYATESKDTYFSLHAGYGGIFLDDKLDGLNSFGDAAYLGIGFPLATSSRAPAFFQNANLNAGIFLQEFKDDENNTISGPIFNRPIYAGLDYQLFSFVHLNAGATLLEKQFANGNVDGDKTEIFVRPFIGLSGKINISLSLDQ